ncbi:MAG: IPT/TIG domain-containing protein [Patescibacteria group bacterium]
MFKSIKKLVVFICLAIAIFTLAHFALALDVGMDGIGEATGLGQEDPRIIAAKMIRIFLGFLGIIAVVLIVYAGWLYMTAEGEEDKIEKAKKILKNAVIGLIICLASFAIASFILSKLLGGNGGGGGIGCDPVCSANQFCCDGVCQNESCNPPPSPNYSFKITSTRPKNQDNNVVRNVVVKTFFNSAIANQVNQTVLDNNFKIEKIADINSETKIETALDTPQLITGIAEIVDDRMIINFKDNDNCNDEKATLNCLPKWSKFKVAINGYSGIVSINNQSLNCNIVLNCEFIFSTNDLLDTNSPLSGIAPTQMCKDDGFLKSDANTVTGWGKDDVGISALKFNQKKDNETEDTQMYLVPGLTQTYQADSYKYDTSAMAVGDKYNFSIFVYDMADHLASSSFTTVIKPGHCCNGVKDVDETDIDCGGNDCLSCFNGPCNKNEPNKCGELNSNCSDSLCSTWFCDCQTEACRCGRKPIIFNIAPLGGFCSDDKNKICQIDNDCGNSNTCNIDTANGAPGNFITIGGQYFGASTGQVVFLGDISTSTDDKIATFPSQVNSKCVNFWQDNQIIAVVPDNAITGPIKVIDSANLWDSTDNNRGPIIKDFQINAIKRPGLCLADPNIGGFGDSFTLQGASFDGTDKKVLFGNKTSSTSADNVGVWTSTTISAKVPNIKDSRNSIFVSVASTTSNSLGFTIKNNIQDNPAIDYISPTEGPKGQYVTIYGRNFKNFQLGVSVVKFYLPANPSILINADVDFPTQCQGRYWHDKYITVKIPTDVIIEDYKVIVTNKDNKTSNPVDFKIIVGSPGPGLCLLDPYNGPVGQSVQVYGDYFGSIQGANGRAVFYNNINSAPVNWAEQVIETKVPNGAQTGPFKIINNNQKISNALPFKVGKCSTNAECDSSEVCCASGTYNAGICKAESECSLGGPKSCVFGWTFSTGRGTTTSLTCGGYSSASACSAVGMCPNTRGECQSRTDIETGDCSDGKCNELANCAPDKCAYDLTLNKCKLTGSSCDTATTTMFIGFTTECRKVGDKNIWQINTKGASCPAGTYLETNNWCSVGDLGNPTECALCSSGFSCQAGQCIISSSGCPVGSTCDNNGKCIKGSSEERDSVCECCCRVANSAQDCCAGLTCDEGGCGSGLPGYGLCTGCRVTISNAADQTLSDQACNCSGNATRYCDLDDNLNYPTGVCKDRAVLDEYCYNNATVATCNVASSTCASELSCNPLTCKCVASPPTPPIIESCSGYGNQCSNSFSCPNSFPNTNKCSSSSSSCDCCCILANNNVATGKNPGCCELLTCEGNCGSDTTEDNDIFGSCTGCAKVGVDQADHNDACNCPGSSGQFCDASVNSNGVCKDCAQIENSEDCSNQGVDTCCVDAKNRNTCRGGAGNKNIINNDNPDYAYCSYYPCDTTTSACDSNNPVASSTFPIYRTTDDCDVKCVIPITLFGQSCAKKQPTATSTCDISACIGFSCLNASSTTPFLSPDCGTCCCDPSAIVDQCKALSTALVCKPNQTPCTTWSSNSKERGLCCGCTSDYECGNGNNNGCSADTCCRARPKVVNPTTPIGPQEICRNTVIEASFNQTMDINSFSNNMFLIGDYEANQCPAGTKFLANNIDKRKNNIFARVIKSILISLEKILKPIFGQNVLAIDHNFCLISGVVSGRNDTASTSVIAFTPQKALDANRKYYVVIQGDASTTDNVKEGVLNSFGVSMNGDDTETFNAKTFTNSKIWWFKTSHNICPLANVIIDPPSYLFQTSENNTADDTLASSTYDTIRDSDKVFRATALATNGQEILPLNGVYSWDWKWSIDNEEVVKFKLNNNNANKQTLIAQNKQDAKTIVKAKATITDDTVNASSTVSQFKIGKANVYVFKCANPWPPVDNTNTWYPWKDTLNNCTAGLGGTCNNNNFEFYYCRDAGRPGTADDLPAILKDTVVRGFSTDLNILKEYYFLREGMPAITTTLSVDDQETGGKVVAKWEAVVGASGYKLYYGKASGKYDKYDDVATSTSPLLIITGLTNGQTYYFAVTAYYKSTGAESGYSNEVSVTPKDITAPVIPTDFNLIASSTDQAVVLTWKKAIDDTAYYQAFYGTASEIYGDSAKVNLANSCSTTECKLTFENLVNNTPYYFAIKAFDRYNNSSGYSNEATSTPTK